MDRIRVASVPSGHAYIQHLTPVDAGRAEFVFLSDPPPKGNIQADGRWWPPAMLDPEWVTQNADRFDVFHVHFGFDALDPSDIQAVVDAVKDAQKGLVYTVHDLQNPHHLEQSLHASQQAVLIDAADALITLTHGAAAEIQERWGRTATVIPHPHIVEFDAMRRIHAEHAERDTEADAPFRVGLHVKSLRPNMRTMPILRALANLAEQDPSIVVQVNGHRDVLEQGGKNYEPELAEFLSRASGQGTIELHVHDYLSDEEFWQYIADLDASVLPYRFGTHSGWLETCRDVGTAVIAPDCGYYADQGPVFTYQNASSFSEDSLRNAIAAAQSAAPAAPFGVAERMQQRDLVAQAHARIYHRVRGEQ